MAKEVCNMQYNFENKDLQHSDGEMAQRLRVLGALPEDKGSIHSTHTVTHNQL